MFLDFSVFFVYQFWDLGAENGLRRAREVFKKVPEGRSSVLTEYEPVGSHGDPAQVIFVFKRQISKVRFLENHVILTLGGSCGSRNIKFPTIVPTKCGFFEIRLPQAVIF